MNNSTPKQNEERAKGLKKYKNICDVADDMNELVEEASGVESTPKEEKKGYECVHAKDDGRLALVKFRRGVEIVCIKCNTCWELDLPFALGMAEDFKTTEDK